MKEDQRSDLLQVYAIERQDNQNSQVVVFAIIAAALTYFVASAAFLAGHYSSGSYNNVPSVVLLVSPLVPLALLSSLVVTISANLMRTKHLKKLEELLGREVEENVVLPSGIRDSSDILEVKLRSSWLRVYTALALTTDIPIFVIALGYTFAVMIPGPWPLYKAIVFSTYCLVIVIQGAGLLVAAFHPRFKSTFI